MKRAGGAMLLLLLVMLAVQKARAGVAAEMLWFCHASTVVLGLGLLADMNVLIASGFLCQIAVAVPAYALHLATGGESSIVSFMLHVLSPLFGWLAWRGRKIPGAAAWCGLGLYLLLIAACLAWTPEALNINLAFHPWAPLSGASPCGIL